MAGNFLNVQPDVEMRVEVGDTTADYTFDHYPEWSRTNLHWVQHTLEFSATDDTTTINFSALSAGATGALISDVEVIDMLRYELVSESVPFAIDDDNNLVVSDVVDYESQDSFDLRVAVRNTGGEVVELEVPVELRDLNEPPEITANETIKTIVGTPATISSAYLHSHDVDDSDRTPDATHYTITELPASGELTLDGQVLVVGDRVSQQHIDDNLLRYTAFTAEQLQDKFGFTLADGGEDDAAETTGQFDLLIRDPLEFDVASEWQLLEGEVMPLSAMNIARSGGYEYDADLLVEVVELSSGFSLINQQSDSLTDGFTFQDLLDDNVLLAHDGSEQHSGAVSLNVSHTQPDSTVQLGSFDVELLASDVADAPTAADSALLTDHLQSLTIDTDRFQFSDGEDGDAFSGIEVVAVPTHGSVQLAGSSVDAGQFIPVASLDQQQLVFLPDASVSGVVTESLDFRVRDTGNTENGGANRSAEVYSIDLTIESDHPPVAVSDAIIVDEGGVINSLVTGDLRVSDNDIDLDTPSSQLLVTLVGAPLHGELQLNTDGSFSYSHNGSETLADSFSYRVVDAQSELNDLLGSLGMVEIEITPVNDLPEAGEAEDVQSTVNMALQIELPQDLFTDIDQGDELTYSARLPDGEPLPDWLSIDETTGELSGTPDASALGTSQIVIVATDTHGATAESQFALTIEPQLDAALAGVPAEATEELPKLDPQVSVLAPTAAAIARAETTLVDQPLPDVRPDTASQPDDNESIAFDAQPQLVYKQAFVDTVVKHNRQRDISIVTDDSLQETMLATDAILELQQLFFIPTDDPSETSRKIQQELNQVRDEVATSEVKEKLIIGGTISLSAGFSIGYVLWLIRGGLLLSSVLASMPAWRLIDPVPILNEQDATDDDDESLQSIAEGKRESGGDGSDDSDGPEKRHRS